MNEPLQLHDYADRAKPYARILDSACIANGYSQLHAFTQIAAESGWDPTATSPVGALGLCQIMPATAADWQCDPLDAASAIGALVSHMKGYLVEFGGNFGLALGAYNAGPGSIVSGTLPNYPETQEYVARIIATVENARPDWPEFWRELLS